MNRGKSVFAVNAFVSLALVILVAAVALVVNPPSPPGISAFAPQASKPIVKALPGQSSVNGSGSGACAQGQVCEQITTPPPRALPSASAARGATSPSAAPVVAGVPSALQCFAWPDGAVTQTFDPQSPPCIPSWPGQAKCNGGSTSTGGSQTTIRVAIPEAKTDSSVAQLQPIVDFLNTHFELYGRKLVLVPFDSQQIASAAANNTYQDPEAQQADAVQAASLHPFAALDFMDGKYFTSTLGTYLDTLAQHHVITVSGGDIAPITSNSELAKHQPYEWTYEPSVDGLMSTLAGLTCKDLVGRDASHASDYITEPRTFAMMVPESSLTGGTLPGQSTLLNRLKACGAGSLKVVSYQDAVTAQNPLTASMRELKRDRITTVILYPYWEPEYPDAPQETASSIGYHPEWLTLGWQSYNAASLGSGASDELASTFGVGVWNKLYALAQQPWATAYTQAGGPLTGVESLKFGQAVYHDLLLLASGVQLAGPDLTPATFAAALHSSPFPNPGAAGAPSYQATVGFAHGSTMVDDYLGFWIAPGTNVAGLETMQNDDAWQYLCSAQLGDRFSVDSLPSQDRFLTGSCR